MKKKYDVEVPGACVFDAYGTLFDTGGAVSRRADLIGDKIHSLNARWREKQLQYTWLRSLQGRYANFEQVTADALDYALEEHGIHDSKLRNDLLELYFALPTYPDARRALARIRSAGMRTLILSNGTPEMLERAITASGIAPLIDDVLSVEAIGVYKPDPRAYNLAVDAVGMSADRIVFVSSNGWDAQSAAAFGLRAIWCNRLAHPRERLPGTLAHLIQSLDELFPYLSGKDLNSGSASSPEPGDR